MARFNLNEALKQKAAQHTLKANVNQDELALDDVSRVKVLSPGRKVFKRFMRNRLAIFGSVLLISMFVLAFFGPLFYPYGQKEVFYKYDDRTVNYGMAKENTAYNYFVSDEGVDIELLVGTAAGSNIKSMIAAGQDGKLIASETRYYAIDKVEEDIYTLSTVETEEVCLFGEGSIFVGNYGTITEAMEYSIAPIAGLEDAVSAHRGGDSFVYDGVTYELVTVNRRTIGV